MKSLFSILEKESNEKVIFEKKVFDIVPGQGAFHQQPNYVRKIIRKEHILMNGKPKVIRRVFCKVDNFLEYQNVGWVLYTDIQNCMMCQKSFPRFIGRHIGSKKHCHICGNIVCSNCLNRSAVRIQEFSINSKQPGYADACASCFWGQDEISISPSYPLEKGEKEKSSSEDTNEEQDMSVPTEGKVSSTNISISEALKLDLTNSNEECDCDQSETVDVASDNTDMDMGGTIEETTLDTAMNKVDQQDVKEDGEEELLDVNRVNLMMLLSTLSVIKDNNPNDPYNINTQLECNDDNEDIDSDTEECIVENTSDDSAERINDWEKYL